MPFGLEPLERIIGGVERRDLAIDPSLAHPARDQLGHLAAEVDDEDGIRWAAWRADRDERSASKVKSLLK